MSTIARRAVPPAGLERIAHPNNPHVLRAELARLERRGEVQRVGAVHMDAQGVYVLVRRLRPPPPPWHRQARILAVLAGVLAGAVGVIWAVAWLVGAALAALPWLAGCALTLALAVRLLGSGGGHGHGGGWGFHWTKC